MVTQQVKHLGFALNEGLQMKSVAVLATFLGPSPETCWKTSIFLETWAEYEDKPPFSSTVLCFYVPETPQFSWTEQVCRGGLCFF